jgi:Fe-S-cluster containining protein
MPTEYPADSADAGSFSTWLEAFRSSLRGELGSAVPCGDCVGCCVSSYHIPIRPTDAGALARIPIEHLVIARGQPEGHRMMRYLSDGHCPMLSDGKCTIYDVRPQTCRDYDCRVFAAAGIDAGGPDKHVINARVRAWRFTLETADDFATLEAIRAAATFIREQAGSFPNFSAPTAPTGIAVLAVKAYRVFLHPTQGQQSNSELAKAIVAASREFDQGVHI